ncbi:MAG TPA: Dabb family protein [Terriglobia bacterium]|jgi:hypothetical protein
MIRHLVFFNLKTDLEPADREWLFDQIHGLSRIRVVTRLALGKLLEPREEWYRPRMSPEFEWALTMEFENEDALYIYQQDPGHVAIAQEIRKRVSSIKVMDFVSLPSQ